MVCSSRCIKKPCGANKIKAAFKQVYDSLYLVFLPVPIEGFEGFITSWVYTGDPVVVVDVGPAAGIAYLCKALNDIGVKQPDVILLTHIHIDHAGGAGLLAKVFPKTPIVCHPKGVKHLIEPEQLWQGSLATLGAVAHAYGPIGAVPEAQLIGADQLSHDRIRVIETLGHSPHHCSFIINNILFAGEAGGVCLATTNDSYYMRPATPPRFYLETYLRSIDKLIACSPEIICYGHIGMRSNASFLLDAHRRQLLQWLDMIRPWYEKDNSGSQPILKQCAEFLLAMDPRLQDFSTFPKQVQKRELTFLCNSLKGYWGYLDSLPQA
jgi:glyoxylase-like metal-dependent hydrolase (beta-lactamase superfamily II)